MTAPDDRSHGRVGRLDGCERAVGGDVDLVQLAVHAVERLAALVDHRQQLGLGVLDRLRRLPERLAEPEERVEEPDADEAEERGQREPREIRRGVFGEDHALMLRGRGVMTPAPTTTSSS